MGGKLQCTESDYQATRKDSQKFQYAQCYYQATQKGSLVTHHNLYIQAKSSNVLTVIIILLRKVAVWLIINQYIWDKTKGNLLTYKKNPYIQVNIFCIINLHIQAESSNVHGVIIRQLQNLNLYIWKSSFNVQSANISSVPKLLFPCIINLHIWANNSNVLIVIISSLRRVAWWLIINVYIWVKSFNVQSVNIRQLRNVTQFCSRDLYMGAKRFNVQSVIIRRLGKVTWLLIKYSSIHMDQKFQCPKCQKL